MIKALLIDGDGVVFAPRDKYFSDRLREDGYDFPKDKEKEFFKNVYPDIRLGKKSLKEEVKKRIKDWNWDKSVEELLEYWFSYENELQMDVIELLQDYRKKGVKVYLASDHSKYRAKDFWENVGLKKYFDGHFISCYLGATKEDPEYYEKVLEELKLQPNEVAFFDDERENIETAKNAGFNAVFYESVEQLKNI